MTDYVSDDQGESFHPTSQEEMMRTDRELTDNEPTSLADLYIGFYDFRQIEFLIFKDRLSSAVLIARVARRGIDELLAAFEAKQRDGSHRVPGWEGESDMMMDETLEITKDSYQISIGATIVTAVAALESLLIDLWNAPKAKPRGLLLLLKAFLRQHKVPARQAQDVIQMGQKIADRRNKFAHSLTGSYWDPASEEIAFTPEIMEETLFTVGKLAVLLQEIVLTHSAD